MQEERLTQYIHPLYDGLHMPIITKKCQLCHKNFSSYAWKGHEAKFCSHECRLKSLAESNVKSGKCIKLDKRIAQCHECGKDFWKRHNDRVFCNTECYLHSKAKQRMKQCIFCKCTFETKPRFKAKKFIFCSNLCRMKYWYEFRKKSMTRKMQATESIKIFGIECEKCRSSKNVECHHLDCNPKNNPLDGSNWMRLCASCHKKTHILIKKVAKWLTKQEIKEMT